MPLCIGRLLYRNCVAYNFWFGVATANKMRDEDLVFCEEVAVHKAGEELVEHGTNTNTAYACTVHVVLSS